MAYGFAFTVVALGASLLYKGIRGWSWAEFYSNVFGGAAKAPAAKAPANAAQVRKNAA